MHLFHAQPISQEELDRATETELTRAARGSIDNASQISSSQSEFEASDFSDREELREEVKKQSDKRKKARKTERKRKTVAKRRKK
jgi:hypothetical protein